MLSSLSGELEFSHTLDLKNPWNDNKPVKISRDGQVSPVVRICKVIVRYYMVKIIFIYKNSSLVT